MTWKQLYEQIKKLKPDELDKTVDIIFDAGSVAPSGAYGMWIGQLEAMRTMTEDEPFHRYGESYLQIGINPMDN